MSLTPGTLTKGPTAVGPGEWPLCCEDCGYQHEKNVIAPRCPACGARLWMRWGSRVVTAGVSGAVEEGEA